MATTQASSEQLAASAVPSMPNNLVLAKLRCTIATCSTINHYPLVDDYALCHFCAVLQVSVHDVEHVLRAHAFPFKAVTNAFTVTKAAVPAWVMTILVDPTAHPGDLHLKAPSLPQDSHEVERNNLLNMIIDLHGPEVDVINFAILAQYLSAFAVPIVAAPEGSLLARYHYLRECRIEDIRRACNHSTRTLTPGDIASQLSMLSSLMAPKPTAQMDAIYATGVAAISGAAVYTANKFGSMSETIKVEVANVSKSVNDLPEKVMSSLENTTTKLIETFQGAVAEILGRFTGNSTTIMRSVIQTLILCAGLWTSPDATTSGLHIMAYVTAMNLGSVCKSIMAFFQSSYAYLQKCLDPKPYAQAEDNLGETAVEAFFHIAWNMLTGETGEYHKDERRSKVVSTYFRSVTTAVSFAEALMKTLNWSLNWAFELLYGIPSVFGKDNVRLRFEAFNKRYDAFCVTARSGVLDQRGTHVTEMQWLHSEASSLLALLGTASKVKDYANALIQARSALARLIMISNGKLAGAPRRPRPVMVVVAGPTNVGKSTMTDFLVSAVQAIEKRPNDPDEVYYRPEGSEYWEGYTSKKRFWIVDDAGQITEKTARTQLAMDWIRAGNTARFPLNMNLNEDKGTVDFQSDYIIATTNATSLRDMIAYSEILMKDAFVRRIDFFVRADIRARTNSATDWTLVPLNPDGTVVEGMGPMNVITLAEAMVAQRDAYVGQMGAILKKLDTLNNDIRNNNYAVDDDELYAGLEDDPEPIQGQMQQPETVEVDGEVFELPELEDTKPQPRASTVRDFVDGDEVDGEVVLRPDLNAPRITAAINRNIGWDEEAFAYIFENGVRSITIDELSQHGIDAKECWTEYYGYVYRLPKTDPTYKLCQTSHVWGVTLGGSATALDAAILGKKTGGIDTMIAHRWFSPHNFVGVLETPESLRPDVDDIADDGDISDALISALRLCKSSEELVELYPRFLRDVLCFGNIDKAQAEMRMIIGQAGGFLPVAAAMWGIANTPRMSNRYLRWAIFTHKFRYPSGYPLRFNQRVIARKTGFVDYVKALPNVIDYWEFLVHLCKAAAGGIAAFLVTTAIVEIGTAVFGMVFGVTLGQSLHQVVTPKSVKPIVQFMAGQSTHSAVNDINLKVAKNLVHVSISSVDGSKTLGGTNALACEKLRFVTVWHPFRVAEAFNKDWSAWEIKVTTFRTANPVSVVFNLDKLTIIHPPNSDLCFFELPAGSMGNFSNITGHFCEDIELIRDKVPGTLTTIAKNHLVTVYSSNALTFKKQINYTIVDNGKHLFDHAVPLAVKADFPSGAGDCGGFWAVDDNTVNRKIVGIHIAGSKTAAYANPISRGFYESAWIAAQSGPSASFANHCGPCVERIEQAPYVTALPNKTSLVKTPLYGSPFVAEKAPAALRPVKVGDSMVSPLLKIFELETKAKIWNPESNKWIELCAPHIVRSVPFYQSPGPLTWEEALNGVPGSKYMRPMKLGTASGYMFNRRPGGKGAWIHIEDGKLVMNDDLKVLVLDFENKLLTGQVMDPLVFSVFLKDELRSLEKVEAADTRMINCADLAYLIVMRRYFLRFVNHLMEHHADFWMTIGANPHDGMEWRQMADDLGMFADGNGTIESDVKKMDASTCVQLMEWTHEIFIRCMNIKDPVEARVCRAILGMLRHKAFHVMEWLVYTDDINPTGHGLTGVLNCFAMIVVLAASFTWAWYDRTGMENPQEYFNAIVAKLHGDDNLQTVPPHHRWYTFHVLKKYAINFGFELTPATKDGKELDFVDPYSATFLKRRFAPEGVKAHAPLEMKTIRNMVQWQTVSKFADVNFRNILRAASIEMMHHGEKAYNEFFDQVNDTLHQRGVKPFVESCYAHEYARWSDSLISYDYETGDVELDPIVAQMEHTGPSSTGQRAGLTVQVDQSLVTGGTTGVRPDHLHSSKPFRVTGEDALTRSYEVGSYAINTSNTVGDPIFQLKFPEALFNVAPYLVARANQWRFFRADVEISIRVQSTPSHTGSMIVAHANTMETDQYAGDAPYSSTLYPYEIHSLGKGTTLTFTMAFNHPHAWLEVNQIINGTGRDAAGIGSVWAYILNPLVSTMTSPSNAIPISVYASFKNVDLQGPTIDTTITSTSKRIFAQMDHAGLGHSDRSGLPKPMTPADSTIPSEALSDAGLIKHAKTYTGESNASVSTAVLPRAADEAAKKTRSGDVSSNLGRFTGAFSILRKIPVVGPIFGVLSALTGVGQVAAELSGYNRPTSTETVERRLLEPAPYHAQGEGLIPAKELSLTQKARVADHPTTVGETKDWLQIDAMTQRLELVHVASYDSSSVVNGVFLSMGVSPMIMHQRSLSGGAAIYLATHLGHYSNLFTYWRGNMRYRILVNSSALQSSRIRVSWFPAGHSAVTTIPGAEGDHYSMVFQITGDTVIDFEIPFQMRDNWAYVGYPMSPLRYSDWSWSCCNGYIALSLENGVVVSQDTATSSVNLAVFQAAGAGFELSGPKTTTSSKITFSKYLSKAKPVEKRGPPPGAKKLGDDWIVAQMDQPESGNYEKSAGGGGTIAPAHVIQADGINVSEKVSDLRTVFHRFSVVKAESAIDQASISNNGTFKYRWSQEPYSPDVQYLLAAFTYYRGSLLWRFSRASNITFQTNTGTYLNEYSDVSARTAWVAAMSNSDYTARGGDSWYLDGGSDVNFGGLSGAALIDTSQEPVFTIRLPYTNRLSMYPTDLVNTPLTVRPFAANIVLMSFMSVYGYADDHIAQPLLHQYEALGDDFAVSGLQPPGYFGINTSAYPYPDI